jgi:hypothetical protein
MDIVLRNNLILVTTSFDTLNSPWMRDFLNQQNFMEVQTPVLENTTGGADARPFITHHNSLNTDLYLRIGGISLIVIFFPSTFILYESPHRLIKCLKELTEKCGPERKAAVCREISKRFEEINTKTLAELIQDYESRDSVKGEIVIIVSGAEELTKKKKEKNLSTNKYK